MTAEEVQDELRALGNPADAAVLARFFKTGAGACGAGDVFAGVRVPATRKLAREHRLLSPAETERLLHSPIHEARLLALLIWVQRAAKGDAAERKAIYERYLANTRHANNWDLSWRTCSCCPTCASCSKKPTPPRWPK